MHKTVIVRLVRQGGVIHEDVEDYDEVTTSFKLFRQSKLIPAVYEIIFGDRRWAVAEDDVEDALNEVRRVCRENNVALDVKYS